MSPSHRRPILNEFDTTRFIMTDQQLEPETANFGLDLDEPVFWRGPYGPGGIDAYNESMTVHAAINKKRRAKADHSKNLQVRTLVKKPKCL